MTSVYAMLARSDETARHLVVHDQDLSSWVYRDMPGDPPTRANGFWQAGEDTRRTEFPSYAQSTPVFSTRVADVLRPSFGANGLFIPVDIKDEGIGSYEVFVPTVVADCLDRERSSPPRGLLELIERVVFVPDQVPTAPPAFRVPDSKEFVFWNEWAAKQIVDLVGEEDIEVRLVWSDIPGARPHPDPMNV